MKARRLLVKLCSILIVLFLFFLLALRIGLRDPLGLSSIAFHGVSFVSSVLVPSI